MCFDVPKVVRSPGYDHGHDEESRNGRDMKIDILEAYVWISEVFRVKSGLNGVPGGYRNPPGGKWALVGLYGEEERRPGLGHAPLPPSPNRTRRGGRCPPFPSSLPPLSPSTPNPTRKREGVLLPVGVGLLLARPSLAGRTSPLAPLYTGAGGTLDTTIDRLIF